MRICPVCGANFHRSPSKTKAHKDGTEPVCSRVCRAALLQDRRGPCSATGCNRWSTSKSLCDRHYQQKRRSEPHTRQKIREREAHYKSRPGISDRRRAQQRSRNLKRIGMTNELLRDLRVFQGGLCAICGVQMHRHIRYGAHREHVDHCHKTNIARGLLCHICNVGLGMYESYQRPTGFRIEPYETYLTTPPLTAFRLQMR